jgi:hypothetical protein
MLDEIARGSILVNESSDDTVATLGRTVEDVGSTALFVFNVWIALEKTIYRCVPLFFHPFCGHN